MRINPLRVSLLNHYLTPSCQSLHHLPTQCHYIIFTTLLIHQRIIDTPGFGNRVNHRDAVRPIAKYMHQCRSRQFQAETSTTLPDEHVEACDDLVHVCLYFLSPGRFLEMDAYFLRRIQSEVCIIPVIAKADTLTDSELTAYRAEITKAFAREGIVPYSFDTSPKDDVDPNGKDATATFSRGRRAGEALAIVSRDGLYTWGEVRSFDPVHSDLLLVRDLLLSQHTETFVQLARGKYGVYRARRIQRRKISDIVKYGIISALALRAMGVPLPYMGNMNVRSIFSQLAAQAYTVVMQFFESMKTAKAATIGSEESESSSEEEMCPAPAPEPKPARSQRWSLLGPYQDW